MTITATFSNGYTDTYSGERDVKAAWMITDAASGEVLLSGHSLDREKAEKTARGNVRHVHLPDLGLIHYTIPQSVSWMNKDYAKELLGRLRENGQGPEGKANVRSVYHAAKKANEEYMAAKRARVEIEVIDL